MSSYHAYAHVRRALGLTAVLAALFAGGCASATRIPLNSANRASAHPAHVVVGLRQQEIGTSIVPSNVSAGAGAAGGLIGGLIGGIVDASIQTSRAKKAESAVVPLRDSLVGYDVGSTLSESLSAEFANIAWLKVEKAEHRSLTQDSLITKWVAESTGNFVLIIELDYRTSPEFDAIALKAKVTAYPRATGAKGLPVPLYHNTLATLLPLPDRPPRRNTRARGNHRTLDQRQWSQSPRDPRYRLARAHTHARLRLRARWAAQQSDLQSPGRSNQTHDSPAHHVRYSNRGCIQRLCHP
jgi:hypothetical protein